MERKDGYYWVKPLIYANYEVAHYSEGKWFLTSCKGGYYDVNLSHINEVRIPSPDEVVSKHRIVKHDTSGCVGFAPMEIEEIFTLESGVEIYGAYNLGDVNNVHVGVKNQPYEPPLKCVEPLPNCPNGAVIPKMEYKNTTIIDLLNCKELPPIFKTSRGHNVDLNRINTNNTDLSDVHTMD